MYNLLMTFHNQVVHLTAFGEGPVVHVANQTIQFNTIPVLTDQTKTIKLTNESLIPARFSCEMVRK